MDKEKVFRSTTVDNKEVELVVMRPGQALLDDAKLTYGTVVAKAIRAGALMNSECENIIKERNLWSEQHEEQLKQLRLELRSSEIKLEKTIDLEEGRDLATSVALKRQTIREMLSPRTDLLSKTAESFAEEAQTRFLMRKCVFYADSRKPFFDSQDKIDTEYNSKLWNDVQTEMVSLMLNLDLDEVVNTAEFKWLVKNDLADPETGFFKDKDGKLRDAEGRLVNKKGQFILEDGRLCDEFQFPLESEEETNDEGSEKSQEAAAPKRRGRPRKEPATA